MILSSLVEAWRASWRLVLVLAGGGAVTLGPVLMILALLLGDSVALSGAIFLVMFPISVFAHEAAHAVLGGCASPPGSRRVSGCGSWLRASIRRPVLVRRHDLAVTLAGPAIGVLCAVPVVVTGPLPALLLTLPFLGHAASLAPTAADGQAILSAVGRGKEA